MNKKTAPKPLTLWEVLMSVLAGAFGVQSSKNLERDFTRGNFVANCCFWLVGKRIRGRLGCLESIKSAEST
ncbi:MAG: hypothetical protein ACJAVI_004301 [Candidatus Azotimanducaceae bacterium]|jgi:hypothetical protein